MSTPMEINLVLTAKRWQLAPQLERTALAGGVQVVKNIPERSYLRITPRQWIILNRFREARTVPQVLEAAIEDRVTPALGEFYELILKAVRARILVEPGHSAAPMHAVNWSLALDPGHWRYPLWAMLGAGVAATFYFKPALPLSAHAAAAGLFLWAVAAMLGSLLAASLLRGAGAEVYRRGWRMCLNDACMLFAGEQRIVLLAPIALLAGVTGLLAWHEPQWSFFPLVGLLLKLRPIFGGSVNLVIRLGAANQLSDAEHHFLFAGNRTLAKRLKLLGRGLRSGVTWVEIGYGVLWTLALSYFFGVLAEVPPWKLAFWQTLGPRLGLAAVGSLVLLGLIYLGWESYVFLRDRARARRQTLRLGWQRWFGRDQVATDEAARLRAVLQAPPFRLLPPPVQQALAKAFKPFRAGPWKILHPLGEPVSHVSLILSGQVGVYRQARTGRRLLVQVLGENDLAGLHAIADPDRPEYVYRTLTPVVLLRVEWAEAEKHILPRVPPVVLASQVQKIPFLLRTALCRNWHKQAIQRFAELSRLRDYREGEVILEHGFYSDSFYIMFESEADIITGGRRVATIGSSSYFGEIGLLQNSNATARVQARDGARCLCIPRKEFLRFVAHNHTVGLELERVSAKRLGRPIFPLSAGNFKQL